MPSSALPPLDPPGVDLAALPPALADLERRVTTCARCPRLVQWRELVAREKRAAFRDEHYWGRPIAGFGDPDATLLILGLAPAAHGANRTGRNFTGDRSGDFLYAGLHRMGFASQPASVHADDGMRLTGAWMAAAVRCAPPANKPTTQERDNCLPWTAAELELLPAVHVILCLGGLGWDAALRLRITSGHSPLRPKPRFGHGALVEPADGPKLLGCFHPSQQNTFTGRLTAAMLDDVLGLARSLST